MLRFTRRAAIGAVAALTLSACTPAGGGDNGTSPKPDTGSDAGNGTEIVQDMILGNPDASVTVIEYASWTCPACLDFDQRVMPMLKSEYIETGKIRFVFREFPTPPANISVAGFSLARCAGPDKYYEVVDELFARQPGILAMVRQGDQVKSALMQIAENHGIKGEEAFTACLEDSAIRRAIATSVGRADASGVNSTPTVFVNGTKLEGYDWRYPEGMRAVLDEALGETEAEPAPQPDAGTDTPAETDGG